MQRSAIDGVSTTSQLAATIPLTAEQASLAAGAAYLDLAEDGSDFVVLTRPEFVETISWAGKPEKLVNRSADGSVRLSPRGSFEVWKEERTGHSEPFDESDLEALRIFRRGLFALNSLSRERTAVRAQRAAEADKARLWHILLETGRKSSLGELASALAHELSQPLFAVSNYVSASRRELANAGDVLPENVDQMMSEAVTEAARAADLVRRLRDFVTDADLERDATAIGDAIRQGVELALVSSNASNVAVEIDVSPTLPLVWADHIQISLVILNFVRNSIAAMTSEPHPKIRITARHDGEMIRVSVADNGPGIPDELRESIFEPFHRSTTGGMGIGLSLCRSIIETHSGRIQVVPTSSGTEIAFTLPVAPQ